jgi:hypothetical protein
VKHTSWLDWLGLQPWFVAQPYQHLAKLYRNEGRYEEADSVLHAARDRERSEAWRLGKCGETFWPWHDEWFLWKSDCRQAVWLGVLKALIGYGIGESTFRVLYWVAGLTLLVTFVLLFSRKAREHGPVWMFGASLDHLLPIVSLNKEFEDFFNDPERERLKGWQLVYFAVHALFGFLLGSFVVAALAGLTQAG